MLFRWYLFFTRCAGRLREKAGDGGRKSVQHLIRKRADDKDFMEIRVAVVGNVDAGKSTLLGKSNAYVNIIGQSNEIFYLPIFSQMDSSQATSIFQDFANLALNSMRNSQFLIDSPLLFIAESGYSHYSIASYDHFSGETLPVFVTIIFINSRLSFITESRYFPCCLLRRVTIPRLIYGGESLLAADSYFHKH